MFGVKSVIEMGARSISCLIEYHNALHAKPNEIPLSNDQKNYRLSERVIAFPSSTVKKFNIVARLTDEQWLRMWYINMYAVQTQTGCLPSNALS